MAACADSTERGSYLNQIRDAREPQQQGQRAEERECDSSMGSDAAGSKRTAQSSPLARGCPANSHSPASANFPQLLQRVQPQSSSCWSAAGTQGPRNRALCSCRAISLQSHSVRPVGEAGGVGGDFPPDLKFGSWGWHTAVGLLLISIVS